MNHTLAENTHFSCGNSTSIQARIREDGDKRVKTGLYVKPHTVRVNTARLGTYILVVPALSQLRNTTRTHERQRREILGEMGLVRVDNLPKVQISVPSYYGSGTICSVLNSLQEARGDAATAYCQPHAVSLSWCKPTYTNPNCDPTALQAASVLAGHSYIWVSLLRK